jgi:hypothetical protein
VIKHVGSKPTIQARSQKGSRLARGESSRLSWPTPWSNKLQTIAKTRGSFVGKTSPADSKMQQLIIMPVDIETEFSKISL